MNDLRAFIVSAAPRNCLRGGMRAFTSTEYKSLIRTSGPNGPRHDADVFLALNSTTVAHYENTAGSNCSALGELSPGGEGIAIPFQALAKERFGSPLYAYFIATNPSKMRIYPGLAAVSN